MNDKGICQIVSFTYFWLCWVFIAARAFSGCGQWELLFVVVCGLLNKVASLVSEHGLWVGGSVVVAHRSQLHHVMWNLPEPWIKPMCPALEGRFLTTGSPGKSPSFLFVLAALCQQVTYTENNHLVAREKRTTPSFFQSFITHS